MKSTPGSSAGAAARRVRLRQALTSIRETGRLLWRACPRHLVASLALAVVVSMLPIAVAQLGRMVVDGAVALMAQRQAGVAPQAMVAVMWLVAAEFGVHVAFVVLERVQATIRHLAGTRLQRHAGLRILEKTLRMRLVDFERPEFYDMLSRARREGSTRPVALIQRLVTVVRQSLTLTGFAIVLMGFSFWMVLVLVVCAIPVLVRELWTSQGEYAARRARAPSSRRLSYLEHVLTTDTYVREVRLFGLGPTLLGEYERLTGRVQVEEEQLARKRVVLGTLVALANAFAFYLCYAGVILSAVRGGVTIGEMTMYLLVCRQAQLALFELVTALGGAFDDALYTSNLFEYLALPEAPTDRPSGPRPTRPELGIRFEQVRFKYPGAADWAIRDLDVFIPRGQSLAIVGGNGAGKTTFVKLLCGLYEPTEGRILLDGRDLVDWSETDLRCRIAAVLQDFSRYQLTLRENILLGRNGNPLSSDKALARAVSFAGLDALAAQLPRGLETQLGQWFDGGVELSGGQWQAVSLARAFMREEAEILVFDEPTSALDAEAEQALYECFRGLAAGRTAILISHRLANVRRADQILVLDRGQSIECGQHDELMALNRRYARLFTMQAAGYQ
jgi:ATP-binding cassette, subfamily B, bacterial